VSVPPVDPLAAAAGLADFYYFFPVEPSMLRLNSGVLAPSLVPVQFVPVLLALFSVDPSMLRVHSGPPPLFFVPVELVSVQLVPVQLTLLPAFSD
jgi:hypothetical protein